MIIVFVVIAVIVVRGRLLSPPPATKIFFHSWYGVRLLPLEEKTAKDSVSVLFVEPQDKTTVSGIEKLLSLIHI